MVDRGGLRSVSGWRTPTRRDRHDANLESLQLPMDQRLRLVARWAA